MDDDVQQMIDDCEKREAKLTDWERGFIDNVSAWLGRGYGITKAQHETLNAVWERVTKDG